MTQPMARRDCYLNLSDRPNKWITAEGLQGWDIIRGVKNASTEFIQLKTLGQGPGSTISVTLQSRALGAARLIRFRVSQLNCGTFNIYMQMGKATTMAAGQKKIL